MIKMHLRIYLVAVMMVLCPVLGWSQATVFTKKARIADIPSKTTKVVLSGNEMMDAALRKEVMSCWRINSYEFCTAAEFEAQKHSSTFYFLVLGTNSDDPGLADLTLIKGGKENVNSVDEYYEVIRMPFADLDSPDGAEFIYMEAYLDIIQRFVEDSMNSDMVGYHGLDSYTKQPGKYSDLQIYVPQEYLGKGVSADDRDKIFGNNLVLCTAEEASDIFLSGTEDAAVAVFIAPSKPVKGSYNYVMLIRTDTHELLYFSRHKCSVYELRGIQSSDLKEFAKARRKK